jgi:hypothetical protein
MATTSTSATDPSPAAQEVGQWDRELRNWLHVGSPSRGFDPTWDQSRDLLANEPEPRGNTTPITNGWGAPLDLQYIVRGGASRASSWTSGTASSPGSGKAASAKSAPSSTAPSGA